MQNTITTLETNDMWELQHLSPRKRAIASKWVYKIKCQPNGEIERYKARFVVRRFTQVKGKEFHESFSLLSKTVIVRAFIIFYSCSSIDCLQLDVNNAFLHRDIEEEV